MKSTLLSLLLLLTVTQLAHGATKEASLSSSLALKPNLNQTFENTNQKDNKDDEDGAPTVPTY